MKTITVYKEHNITIDTMYRYLRAGGLKVWESLTDNQKQWAFDYIQEVVSCKEHLSDTLLNDFIRFDLTDIMKEMNALHL